MDAVTRSKDDFLNTPNLNYEAWRESFRLIAGRYQLDDVEPTAFIGWSRRGSVFGFGTHDLTTNLSAFRRTCRDIRLDGADEYVVAFHVSGKNKLFDHNDHAMRVAAGNAVLVDKSRPLNCLSAENGDINTTISINLPRKGLVSHLGFDPQGGLCRPSAVPAARLLLDLIRSSGRDEGSEFSPSDAYMQLVIYDLVGALFASAEPGPVSRRTDRLFTRISGVIKDGFGDSDFGPAQAAAEAGISLRYLHKLFMERGLTCQEFIYSRRLDHAARLLRRRARLDTDQPLSDIAYACGFSDYAHFARKFRQRYGQAPGAYSAAEDEG